MKTNKQKSSNSKASKPLKVYFCPACKSFDVGFVFGLKNVFGIIPNMKCKKCNYSGCVFPLAVIDKDKLNSLERKIIKNNKNLSKELIICPKCKSSNFNFNMRSRGNFNYECKNCGYQDQSFLILSKTKTKKLNKK